MSSARTTSTAVGRRGGRHRARSGRLQPYAWLGAGALTLGVGGMLAVSAAPAQADSDSTAASSDGVKTGPARGGREAGSAGSRRAESAAGSRGSAGAVIAGSRGAVGPAAVTDAPGRAARVVPGDGLPVAGSAGASPSPTALAAASAALAPAPSGSSTGGATGPDLSVLADVLGSGGSSRGCGDGGFDGQSEWLTSLRIFIGDGTSTDPNGGILIGSGYSWTP